ncbi:MAG: CsgG/HfaB family protein [Gemmatimonadales bacterium]
MFGGSLGRVAGALGALALALRPAALPAQAEVGARLRVAVLDLSGSALRIQTTQMPMAVPPAAQPYAQPGQAQQTTVAIAIPPPTEFARGLTEMLTSVLIRTGRFTVLERAAMSQVEQEQALTAGGRVTVETAAASGALLGAQVLITGDITGFTFEKSSVGGALTNVVRGLSVATERVSASVVIDLRLIDASTGEVVYSAKGTGKASQTGIAADLIRDEKSYSVDGQLTTPLGHASRQAIQNAVISILTGMPRIRWSGRVADVRDEVVYLNAALADGMKPGLELEVFEAGEALVDPATGKSLGAPETRVGAVVVERVLEQYSTARIVDGQGIARGQVVRVKEQRR